LVSVEAASSVRRGVRYMGREGGGDRWVGGQAGRRGEVGDSGEMGDDLA